MPEWLWIIIVGGVVMGLISIIYANLTGRVYELEKWKENRPALPEILTISKHYEFCKDNTKEIQDSFRAGFADLKNEIFNLKIEVRKMNGS